MNIEKINIQIYREYLDTLDEVVFQQSDYQAKKFAHDGWSVEFIQAKDEGQVFATCMLAFIPLMKIFKYCYIPRGFIADYKNEKKLIDFVSVLKIYLKNKNVVYLETDPEIDLQQRDIDGNVVEDGWNNFDIVKNLKNAGFIQLPLTQGYNLSKECRWCSVLDLKNKTADEVFKEFSYSTRQDVRSTQKYSVKVRKLKPDELYVLDSMEQETSKRHNFHAFDLNYYNELYQFYGADHVETWLSYLDLDEYSKKIKKEYDKTVDDIEKTKEFLTENPNSIKKEKRLKTAEEYYLSLKKKINQIENLKDEYGNEVPLACCLFLKYSNQIIYLVGSSNYKERVFRGPYAIHWYMIQEAILEGYEYYNFYGISGLFKPEEEGFGVFDFKRGFNAVVHEYIGNFILPCKPIVFSVYNHIKHVVK